MEKHVKPYFYNFSEILYKLKAGNSICRDSNKDQIIYMKNGSVMTINIKNDIEHSYVFSNTDVFANDWLCIGPASDYEIVYEGDEK